MGELGEFLGFLIVVCFVLAGMKYVFRLVDEKYFLTKVEEPKIYKTFKKIYDLLEKYHALFGILALVFIIAHLTVQTIYVHFSYTGIITAGLMAIQIGLGLYGKKATTSGWYKIHRILPILIAISFFLHLVV